MNKYFPGILGIFMFIGIFSCTNSIQTKSLSSIPGDSEIFNCGNTPGLYVFRFTGNDDSCKNKESVQNKANWSFVSVDDPKAITCGPSSLRACQFKVGNQDTYLQDSGDQDSRKLSPDISIRASKSPSGPYFYVCGLVRTDGAYPECQICNIKDENDHDKEQRCDN